MSKFVWTEQSVALLKTLHAKGWSASGIAREIGSGVTRNAVIGKIHRLGLRIPTNSPESKYEWTFKAARKLKKLARMLK